MISELFRWVGFVAVCLVVTIHLPFSPTPIQSFLHEYVSPWAVPWFFFASGFWTAGRTPSWKRIKSLLVPYVIANAIWFAIMAVVQCVATSCLGMEASRFGFTVADVLGGFGLTALLPALVPTWFLRALMVFIFTAPLVGMITKWNKVCGFLIAGLVFLGHFYLGRVDLTPGLRGFLTFAFPTFGFACYVLGTVLGIVVGARKLPVKGTTNPFTHNVFAIYLFHVPILLLCSYALRPFDAWGWTKSDLGFFVLWPSLVMLSILFAKVFRRCCPRFSQLLLGGR